jgi:cell division protein FtsB
MKRKTNFRAPVAQFIAIIVLTISIFLIVDFGRRAAVNYRVQRESARLEQEVEAAQRYQARLLAQRTYAASDLYVEEVARRELKWAKPGETVVVVIPEEQLQASQQESPQEDIPTAGAISPQQAWWHLFFGPNPT